MEHQRQLTFHNHEHVRGRGVRLGGGAGCAVMLDGIDKRLRRLFHVHLRAGRVLVLHASHVALLVRLGLRLLARFRLSLLRRARHLHAGNLLAVLLLRL